MSLLLPGEDGFEASESMSEPLAPLGPLATGIGSMPGGEARGLEVDNARVYTEAVKVVLGELDRGAHLPEMPGRGAIADMVGRGLAVVGGLAADLQPAGWRLTGGGVGVDQRRARSLLSQDLDTVEEVAQDYDGIFKVQVAGPWTLAATVEKPRGDKVLSDHGARRDLAQGLAEGLRDHIADVRRRIPAAARLVVQLDEPALAAVMQAKIPTASGFSRHRRVDPPEASALLAHVLGAVTDAGAEAWVHSCAADVAWDLVSNAGATGLLVDLDRVDATGIDHLATHLEGGGALGLGVVPSTDPTSEPSDKVVTERVLRWLDMVGFDPEEYAGQLVVTPACGLAGASDGWAQRALGLAGATARHLS